MREAIVYNVKILYSLFQFVHVKCTVGETDAEKC